MPLSVPSVPPTTLKKSISPLRGEDGDRQALLGVCPPSSMLVAGHPDADDEVGPTASRMAPNTSSAKRQRFSRLPP